MKGHLRGKHFEDDNELKREEWLYKQEKTFDLNGIEKLREHYNNCAAVHDDYLEK